MTAPMHLAQKDPGDAGMRLPLEESARLAVEAFESSAPETQFLTLDQWQTFAESHPQSTAFHHRRWIELILQQYGGECLIPAIRRGGRTVTAIPFVETRSISGKRRLISLPFSDCVPVLSEAEDPGDDALRCVASLAGRGYRSIVVRSDRSLGDAPTGDDGVRHVLDLRAFADIADAYDPKLRSNMRRNYRRAAQHRITLQQRSDREAMEAFYGLHVMTRRKLGIPVQPKRFFDRLHEMVLSAGLGYIVLVEQQGTAIAAGVFLDFNHTVIYKYSASDPRAMEHRPTELLLDFVIRRAAGEGRRYFDFGFTAQSNEGLRRFKCKWGAVESNAPHVYFVGEPRPRAEDSPLVKLASSIIRRSPPVMCRLLGEALYRFSQ